MSNLLIEEPPLQVLPSLALAVGLNEAIILQQMHYWLKIKQQASDKYADSFRDGRWRYRPRTRLAELTAEAAASPGDETLRAEAKEEAA